MTWVSPGSGSGPFRDARLGDFQAARDGGGFVGRGRPDVVTDGSEHSTRASDDAEFTLEQKAALGGGASFWRTKAVAGVSAVAMSDGPHGVRFQAESGDHLGLGGSVPATCFPPAVGLAQ